MTCAAVRPAGNGIEPMGCTLEAGHGGAHGIAFAPGLAPFIAWRENHDAPPAPASTGPRKKHRRREYDTLARWKARRGL